MNGIALSVVALAFSCYSMWAGVDPGWFHVIFMNILLIISCGIQWLHHNRIEQLENLFEVIEEDEE